MKDFGISSMVGMIEAEGTYLLAMLSAQCPEPGRFLF